MDLALALGMPLKKVLKLDEEEIIYWMARYELRPFGDAISWAQHGQRMAFDANLHRKKSAKPYSPDDFIPDFKI
jgi:hypothetical protein